MYIYAPLDKDLACLREYQITSGALSLTGVDADHRKYLNPKYISSNIQNGIQSSTRYYDRLSVDLATGDFNGDGLADLAVLSYTNDISSTYDGGELGLYTPFLSVGFGSATGIPHNDPSATQWLSALKFNDTQTQLYSIPVAGGLAVGDIDNDARDELVVAGYYGETTTDLTRSPARSEMLNGARDAGHIIVATYDATSAITAKTWETLAANGWLGTTAGSATGVWLHSDYVWQPMGVACAALDGPLKAECVFVGGSVYTLDANKLTHAYTPAYFKQEDRGVGGAIISVTFISSVIAGNFDGNQKGYEQFMFTVGAKTENLSTYHYLPGVVCKTDVLQDDGSTKWDFFGSDVESTTPILSGVSNAQVTLAPVNRKDSDLIRVRFSQKGVEWTDPKVEAILQAAPYFAELGGYSTFARGATQYSVANSYERTTGETYSQTLGAGLHFEADGGVAKGQIDAGYIGKWASEVFNTQKTEQTYSVSSAQYDTVIVKRTPIYEFSYDVWDYGTNQWAKEKMLLTATRDAMYYPLSIEDYNAFVAAYNTTMAQTQGFVNFGTITAANAPTLMGNEGDPYAYTQDLGTVLSQPVGLGYDGGAQTVTYAASYGSGTKTESSKGFTLGLSVCFGSPAYKIGAYANADYEWGHSKSVTNLHGTQTAGNVNDLDVSGLASALGVSEGVIRQYGFDWTFGKWNMDLGGAGQVPVYGYSVRDVSAPPPRVMDLAYTLTNSGTSLVFNWTAPDATGREPIAGYYLYVKEGDGAYQRYSDALITDTAFTLAPFDRTKGYTFVVSAAARHENTTTGTYSYAEGVYSNPCVYRGDLSGKSAYEIAVEKGFKGTVEEWLRSLIGGVGGITSIQKTGTAGNVDTYTITYSDGTTDTFTVTNGTVGADGRDTELRATSDGTIQWRYVDEDIWTDLLPLANLTGNDGRDVEFDIQNGHLLWRYVTEITRWENLGRPEVLISGFDTAKEAQYRVDGGYIQWRYTDASNEWTNLRAVADVTGNAQSALELQTDPGTEMLQWRETIEYEWQDLGLASTLRGEDGTDGREVELRTSSTHVQWRYAGTGTWTDLIGLASLQGLQGETGRGIVRIGRTGTSGSIDTYTITYSDGTTDTFTVTNGAQGPRGRRPRRKPNA